MMLGGIVMSMEFTINEIKQCYNFAKAMVGNHNPDMIMVRKDWEIFRDDIRGKLGEIAVRRYIEKEIPNAIINTNIDFNVTPRGSWDITDLVVNNKYLSVKAIRGHSEFLLIETKRYDENGNYKYSNNDGNNVKLDYYVLTRIGIEPEITKSAFAMHDFETFINEAWSGSLKKEVIRRFTLEVLGGISHENFWINKTFAPKGIKCSVPNLRAITNNTLIENLPQKLRGNEKRNEILQQDNYVISGESSKRQFCKLEEILS